MTAKPNLPKVESDFHRPLRVGETYGTTHAIFDGEMWGPALCGARPLSPSGVLMGWKKPRSIVIECPACRKAMEGYSETQLRLSACKCHHAAASIAVRCEDTGKVWYRVFVADCPENAYGNYIDGDTVMEALARWNEANQ